mmetsp:Transcript_16215/g.18756  ORF Transcript_16215/g.18756 Transcript_16215/m.18756 type:complete len:88 (+) Transcript_16215:1056-1319(+)
MFWLRDIEEIKPVKNGLVELTADAYTIDCNVMSASSDEKLDLSYFYNDFTVKIQINVSTMVVFVEKYSDTLEMLTVSVDYTIKLYRD